MDGRNKQVIGTSRGDRFHVDRREKSAFSLVVKANSATLSTHSALPINEPYAAPPRCHQGIALPHFSLIEDSVYSQQPHNGGIHSHERRL
ncbi:hypothetical protein E2C01_096782 [Portunus trituberculatus]|uniref:Uncharacterized protein n=1 Tax=Portunus trituberculatus TaxID=210409 RepID=A0A5B7JYS2_PORTR|nr:hypothetical protein [Portunus trituberculatus]